MKVIAFGASNSLNSINKKLATHVASLIKNAEVEILDLNDYEMPLYGIDKENRDGIPSLAYDFIKKLESADLIIISFAEHNGIYTTAFKNLLDWSTRVKKEFYSQKNLIFLATSPGAGGAKSVLDFAAKSAIHFGGKVIGSLSVPKFNENFDLEKGELKDQALLSELDHILSKL